ncbi:MAG: YccF domain-containing protein [Clostridium sp.]|nr:YccF domain-containing protein [Clostridium sp.]
MRFLGNILWIIFGGLIPAIEWFFFGILWSITIIGLPVGRQCFKMARLQFAPFGKKVNYGGGLGSGLLNILWILFGGFALFLTNITAGVAFALTIVGIPFAKQSFKMAKLSLMPFGTKVY